jgi:hypothetical protein
MAYCRSQQVTADKADEVEKHSPGKRKGDAIREFNFGSSTCCFNSIHKILRLNDQCAVGEQLRIGILGSPITGNYFGRCQKRKSLFFH